MKKKALFLVMGMCMVLAVGGCAKKGVAGDLNSTNNTTPTAAPDNSAAQEQKDLPKVEDYVASDYITLGQYKGVEVTVTPLTVTDAQVDTAIQDDLKANATKEAVTGRAVQNGDIVNIDYEGLLDGKAFDGGTAKAQDLEIGSNSFIPGFESGLIGHNIGEKVALNITFPADYGATDLAGKAVVFNVTINSISKSVVPELTDDYVKANTDYDTVAAYKEGKRKDLESANQDKMNQEKASNVIKAIIDKSTIKSVPQTLTDYYKAQIEYSFQQEAAYYSMDIQTYVTSNNMTMDNYNQYVSSLVQAYSQRDLLINAVAQTEKLQATDDEYQKAVTDYKSYYKATTDEDLFAIISEKEIKNSVVMQKAYDFIISNAVVTDATPTPAK